MSLYAVAGCSCGVKVLIINLSTRAGMSKASYMELVFASAAT